MTTIWERAIGQWRCSPVTALVVGWLMPDVAELMHDLARDAEREPCGRQSATCSRPDDCHSCYPWERR